MSETAKHSDLEAAKLRILPLDGQGEPNMGFVFRAVEENGDVGHWGHGESGASKRVWADSFGRLVSVPANIKRVAPAQSLAHEIVDAVGHTYVATEPPHQPNAMRNRARMTTNIPIVPYTGLLGYGTLTHEDIHALHEADVQLIVSVERGDRALPDGDFARAGMGTSAEALDRLQEQTGIPVIGFNARWSFADVFDALGELLECNERAGELSAFMDESYRVLFDGVARMREGDGKRKCVAFIGNPPVGHAVANFHGKLFRLLGIEPYGRLDLGMTRNSREAEIDIEKLRGISPDAIVFSSPATNQLSRFEIQYGGHLSKWLSIDAIQKRRFYDAPDGWLCWPPLMVQAIGVLWLVWRVLDGLPDFNMEAHASKFIRLFFGSGIPERVIGRMVSVLRSFPVSS